MQERLTRHEWIIMETLWNKSPLFLSDIMEAMATAVDWNKSSFSTYLKRMIDKGCIGFETVRGSRQYYPLVGREDCIASETNAILSKMTQDSKRLLLTSMIKKSGLDESELGDLLALIEEMDGR